jgi:hypothetical protein
MFIEPVGDAPALRQEGHVCTQLQKSELLEKTWPSCRGAGACPTGSINMALLTEGGRVSHRFL